MHRNVAPWLLTAVFALLAAASFSGWVRLAAPPAPSAPAVDGEDRVRALRARIATMESEASALRAELDRMRAFVGLVRRGETAAREDDPEGQTDAERRARLVAALARLDELIPQIGPDAGPEVFEGLQDVLRAMLRAPMDDAGPFVEQYRRATNPIEQTFLLPQLAARYGDGLTQFVSDELDRVGEPLVRSQLLAELRVHGSAVEDPVARGIFLRALDDEDSRARRLAVEALMSVPDLSVRDRLFDLASGDPAPDVRELAVRRLASDPANHERLLDALSGTPDQHLRSVGECAVRLAASP